MSPWVVEGEAGFLSGGRFQVRAELSNGSFLQLNRSDEDVAQMMKRLVDGFPEMLSCRLLSEIMRSNGFCLANTETILFDLTPPTQGVTQSDHSTGRRDDGQDSEEVELETQNSPAPPPHTFCLTSHLLLTWTQETNILDEL
ncbi:PX domain-containing protein 1-like protein [Lates japonicus]|uniref:PX domain-containing protein 1-like protein n=1 Tax=Lates japonicus TaxID=270547 RepID=A0AAD3RM87_LATJO|nr:PX domain-containing protein 1-like protein [Lates japonicus]